MAKFEWSGITDVTAPWLVALSFLASACGAPEGNIRKDSLGNNPNLIDSRRATEVALGLQAVNGGLQFAAPTTGDFVIQISGCSSGYNPTVTSTTDTPRSSVALYTGDANCIAGLQSFTWSGVAYNKNGGGTLTSGSSLFSNGTKQLYVTVGTQLSTTISSTSKANFLISEVKIGDDYAVSGYSSSSPLSVSTIEAPEVIIPANGITLAAINATTGVATFNVHAQCINTNSPGPSSCRTPGGEDQLFSNMKAKLITDTFGGVINFSNASASMSTGATAVADPVNLKTTAPITTEGFMLSLSGAGQLYANKNMILIIEYTDPTSSAKSYRYFNVDIGDPQ